MEHLALIAQLVGAVAIVWMLVVLIGNARELRGTPTAAAFLYFSSAVALLALIQLFLHLAHEHTIAVSESTASVAWHVMFYLSMAMFVAGTTALLGAGRATTKFGKAVRRGTAPLIAGGLVFIAAIAFDDWIADAFGGSLADRIGIVHFIAFAMCVAVVLAMRRLRGRLGSSYLSSIATPTIWAVFMLGLIHFWELLTESWELIEISEETVETVEVLLLVPAVILLLVAFRRTRR